MAVNTGATLLGFVQVVRDVSDRRRAHDAAVESERSFRLLVEGGTDYSIFMLSPGRLITSWNLGASRIKGYSAHEIIGSHFPRFFLYRPMRRRACRNVRSTSPRAKDASNQKDGGSGVTAPGSGLT